MDVAEAINGCWAEVGSRSVECLNNCTADAKIIFQF